MKRLLLDTNVVVRFLLGESSAQGEAAARLFAQSDRQELTLVLEPLVFAESLFVLTSFYKKSRQEVVDALAVLMSAPGVECLRRKETSRALDYFKKHPSVHWVDCFLAALSAETGFPVASFDRDFDQLAGAARVDPASL